MTHLSALRRPAPKLTGLVLLAAAFLLIGSGRLLGQHACPHHEGGATGEGAAAHGPGYGPGHASPKAGEAAAEHRPAAEEHAPGSAAHHGHDQDGGAPAPCTCIGTCHGAAATPLLPSGALLSGGQHEFHRVPAASAAEHIPSRLLSWLLPPANGPPFRA